MRPLDNRDRAIRLLIQFGPVSVFEQQEELEQLVVIKHIMFDDLVFIISVYLYVCLIMITEGKEYSCFFLSVFL